MPVAAGISFVQTPSTRVCSFVAGRPDRQVVFPRQRLRTCRWEDRLHRFRPSQVLALLVSGAF